MYELRIIFLLFYAYLVCSFSTYEIIRLQNESLISELLPLQCVFSGKVVAKKEINEVIQRFNIQVNNLTQVSFCLVFDVYLLTSV